MSKCSHPPSVIDWQHNLVPSENYFAYGTRVLTSDSLTSRILNLGHFDRCQERIVVLDHARVRCNERDIVNSTIYTKEPQSDRPVGFARFKTFNYFF